MLSGLRVAPCLGCRFGISGTALVFGHLTVVHQGPRPAFGQQLEAEVSQELCWALQGNPIPVTSQGAVECDIGSSLVCLGCGRESLECLWEHHQVSWEMQSPSQAFGMSRNEPVSWWHLSFHWNNSTAGLSSLVWASTWKPLRFRQFGKTKRSKPLSSWWLHSSIPNNSLLVMRNPRPPARPWWSLHGSCLDGSLFH